MFLMKYFSLFQTVAIIIELVSFFPISIAIIFKGTNSFNYHQYHIFYGHQAWQDGELS